MTLKNKGVGELPSQRLDSHQNSVQNGMVERFTVFMATISVQNFNFYATATSCPLDENAKKDQKTKKLRKAGQAMACERAAKAGHAYFPKQSLTVGVLTVLY